MARRTLLIAVLSIVASCGNKSEPGAAAKGSAAPPPATAAPTPPATPTPAQPTDDQIMAENIAAMTAAADRMCACKDVACTDAVAADVAKYFADLAKKYDGRPDPDPKPDDAAKLSAIGERYGECAAKIKLEAAK